jgi:hypothetical protein
MKTRPALAAVIASAKASAISKNANAVEKIIGAPP